MAQLYSVRSRASWGVGDLADLAEIGWLAGRELGADFLLINPLHAAEPTVPLTPSPYLPTTRRFVNPLYIRVEDIRETGYLSSADRALVEWAAEPVLAIDDDAGPIDRDAAWAAKRAALEVVFAAPRSAARQAAFDAFVEQEGSGLETSRCGARSRSSTPASSRGPPTRSTRRPRSWPSCAPSWPSASSSTCGCSGSPTSSWRAAQRAALDGGMALGIMHDLAVGVHPEGADAWALGDVLARGATVGAPPDMYNQQGQNWSQPPWRPDALARAAYAPYRDMLRTVLRHAGAIRIDHVIGLFRLWWIPEGADSADGAYVRYDHEALIGILALEAHRAGAVVIGEDLGVVEPWVRDYLSERGMLGTSVLWFERDMHGAPLAPEDYRPLVLATVTTHDLPPTAGYLAGEHVAIRERLGPAHRPGRGGARGGAGRAGPDARRAARARPGRRRPVRARDRRGAAPLRAWRRRRVLVGVSLADAVGERRAQNQPGTDKEYPNWKVPLADGAGRVVLVEDLFTNPRLRSLAAVLNGLTGSCAVCASSATPGRARPRSRGGWPRRSTCRTSSSTRCSGTPAGPSGTRTRRARWSGRSCRVAPDGWVTDGNWATAPAGCSRRRRVRLARLPAPHRDAARPPPHAGARAAAHRALARQPRGPARAAASRPRPERRPVVVDPPRAVPAALQGARR